MAALSGVAGVDDAEGNGTLWWGLPVRLSCCVRLLYCRVYTNLGEAIRDDVKGGTGFSAEEELVRAICDVGHLPSFNGLTRFVFARQAEYSGPKDIVASIVGSVHSHGYWDEVRCA